MSDLTNNYPSPLIHMNLSYQQQHGEPVGLSFVIPKNEVFRIKDVIENSCYALPNFRRSKLPDVVVDIGANVGCYAIYVKMNHPTASIYCFEPVPATVELLSQNTKAFSDIHIHPIALSNNNKTGWIEIHPINSGENRLCDQKVNQNNRIAVPVHDADTVFTKLGLKHIDILKIDTEGCEVQILESLRKRLSDIDYIVLEYHSEDDRRRIDAILHDFTLISCSVSICGLGILKYVNASIISMIQ
ncbi:MAG: FkbM family methyltransferase [Candidatus Magnetomorum sp.]|nr:FkbM family methyltransferase [Candidatus Magnetomorum sp.]